MTATSKAAAIKADADAAKLAAEQLAAAAAATPAGPPADAPADAEPTAEEALAALIIVRAALAEPELVRATAVAVLPGKVGHTNNHRQRLAEQYWPVSAPTLGEYIGAFLEGAIFYTGHIRAEVADKPGTWEAIDLREKHGDTNETANGWYLKMHRLDAYRLHVIGAKAAGWAENDKAARLQPTKEDLRAIIHAADPKAEALRIASAVKTAKGTNTPDGLNATQRAALLRDLKAALGKLAQGKSVFGALTDIADEYSDVAIMATLAVIAETKPTLAQYASGMAAMLTGYRADQAKTATALAEAEAKAKADAEGQAAPTV